MCIGLFQTGSVSGRAAANQMEWTVNNAFKTYKGKLHFHILSFGPSDGIGFILFLASCCILLVKLKVLFCGVHFLFVLPMMDFLITKF